MPIETTRDEGVATVTIANPARKNAMDAPLSAELADRVHDLAHDDGVRCVYCDTIIREDLAAHILV